MKNVILADDDIDDCDLFADALKELSFQTQLSISENGVILMTTLENIVPPPPYVVFLDLNMPLKNGYECLAEIRRNAKLKDIMVVIFSTTGNQQAIEKTFSLGANFYVRKPHSFELLKKSIETVLLFTPQQRNEQPSFDKYFLAIN